VKITLHITAARGLEEMLRKHRILAMQFPKGTMSRVKFSDTDAMCDLLFEYSADYEPKPIFGSIIVPACLFVATECQLDALEWGEVKLFEARAGKIWRVPETDDRINFKSFNEQSLIDKDGWASIRLPPKMIFRYKVKPSEIVNPTDWTDEYLIGRKVQSVFAAEEFSGFRLGLVLGAGGKSGNSSCAHLLSDYFGPPCLKAATVWDADRVKQRDPNKRTRFMQKGFLCLPANASAVIETDLCRTSDPLSSIHGAGWLVNKRVVEAVSRHGLVGWSFAPVLIEGSQVYEEYQHRMKRLESLISLHRYNELSNTWTKGIPAEKILKMTS
jgi:hypothetical protein